MTRVRGRGSFPMLLLALLLAVVGCQAPITRAKPNPSAAPGLDRRVQSADQKLYRGDYEGAESDYRALARDAVPGAAAHLSTLLAYEGRFGEAVVEAQAGVSARADSDSLARLTRALDWSEDVDGAVGAGARAVAARPVHPLAHVFYSEALADAGRFQDAARQLRIAEDMGGDAYVQAEIDREWANYSRGRGDAQSELNFTELAIRAQGGFPERQLDLVRYDYGNRKPDTARGLADKLLAAHPQSYRLLVAIADAALIGGDGERATTLYKTAAAARPDGAEAALGQAELHVAANREFDAAHDLLLDVLKRNPNSSPVYEYLRYLDLLVLKKDPAADLAAVAPQAPAGLAADRKTALDLLNGRRSALGLPALGEDAGLAEAAQAHAYFYLFNIGQPQLGGLGIYMEDPALPGFTGAHALDRERHFGYGGSRSAEVIDHAVSPAAGVGDWVNSVFHRYPLLDREAAAVGYGQARVGSLSVAVMDLGFGPAGAADAVVYPAADQAGVPASFSGNELPDPLPDGAVVPTGYPITIQVGGAQKLTVTRGRLLGPDGREVAGYPLQPGAQVSPAAWGLVPKRPLQPGARYTVEVTGTADGMDFSKRWSFTVSGP